MILVVGQRRTETTAIGFPFTLGALNTTPQVVVLARKFRPPSQQSLLIDEREVLRVAGASGREAPSPCRVKRGVANNEGLDDTIAEYAPLVR